MTITVIRPRSPSSVAIRRSPPPDGTALSGLGRCGMRLSRHSSTVYGGRAVEVELTSPSGRRRGFRGEQRPLQVEAPVVASERAGLADDAVAGDQVADAVAAAGRADGARRPGLADRLGEPAVADRGTGRGAGAPGVGPLVGAPPP